MTDYISREAAKEVCALIALTSTEREMTCGEVKRMVESIPAADVREVVHGHWIESTSVLGSTIGGTTIYKGYKCSVCGALMGRKNDVYCYKCGADMREEQT